MLLSVWFSESIVTLLIFFMFFYHLFIYMFLLYSMVTCLLIQLKLWLFGVLGYLYAEMTSLSNGALFQDRAQNSEY